MNIVDQTKSKQLGSGVNEEDNVWEGDMLMRRMKKIKSTAPSTMSMMCCC